METPNVKVQAEKKAKLIKKVDTDKVNLNKPFVMTPRRQIANDKLTMERGELKQKLKEQRELFLAIGKAERAKTSVLIKEMRKATIQPVRKPRVIKQKVVDVPEIRFI